MTRDQQREGRGVDNPQSMNAYDPGLRINNSHGIISPAHLAGAAGVPDRGCSPHNNRQDILISSDVCTREGLRAYDDLAESLCRGYLARPLEGCDGDLLVARIRQYVRADNGIDNGIGAIDSDVAPAEGRNDGWQDRDVLSTVSRRTYQHVVAGAVIGVGECELDRWPVRFKLCRQVVLCFIAQCLQEVVG